MIAQSGLFLVSLYCKGLVRWSLDATSLAIPLAMTDNAGGGETVTDQVSHASACMDLASRQRLLAHFSADQANRQILDGLRGCLN